MTKQEIKEFLDWNGLIPCFTMFDEHGWKGSFSKNNWRVANGGYDLWFELYYNDQPVVDCIAGKLSAWGMPQDVLDEICRRIIRKFPHLKMERLEEEVV